jgi:hypothetical protein
VDTSKDTLKKDEMSETLGMIAEIILDSANDLSGLRLNPLQLSLDCLGCFAVSQRPARTSAFGEKSH